MGDGLNIVDIGNFCLLAEKYRTQIEEAGINNNSENNKMLLEKCSESISDQLKIMDECQKILYKHGYRKDDVEYMKKVRDMFKEGVETMQEVLEAFCIALDEQL